MNSAVLDDIARVIGYTPTRYLLAWYGGRQLYVPKTASPWHPLRKLIGLGPFNEFVEWFGDQRLKIPSDCEDGRYRRDRRMAERFAEGAGVAEIAFEFRIGMPRVVQLRRELSDRGWLEYAAGPPTRGRWRGHPPPKILGTGEVFAEPPPPSMADAVA